MKKSVLTSLIAASALFTGVAFAGSYTADAGYTAADTSAMAGSENGFLQGLYVGVGVNKSATNTNTTTIGDTDVDSTSVNSSKYGYGVLVGKKLNDIFAAELSYNSYGKNAYNNADGSTTTYDPMWSTMLMGVVNSTAYYGISGHLKGGVSYNSVTTHVATDGVTSSESQYRGANLAYGLGLEYDYKQFGLSADWTRVQTQSNSTNGGTSNVYVPDVYSLTFLFNFA
ncbi:MAG: hypothetical protein V4496_00280 [Pseudomonadota bacterium]